VERVNKVAHIFEEADVSSQLHDTAALSREILNKKPNEPLSWSGRGSQDESIHPYK
jgi:hypothetical protein